MQKVCFIVKGIGRISQEAQAAIDLARKSELIDEHVLYTSYEKHAIYLAKEFVDKTDVLVAVGGDGTFNEVLQGLMSSKRNKQVKLGLIPGGTGNDFARNFDEFSAENFIEALLQNRSRKIDVGCAEFEDKKRFFINIADLGFGAKVIEIMNRQRKRGIRGKFSYAMAIFRSFFAYRKTNITLHTDGFQYEGKYLLIAFCNGHSFGHGLKINPHAEVDDGKLSMTLIGNVSLMTYFRKLKELKEGYEIQHPEAHYFEGNEVIVDRVHPKAKMEGDGELFHSGVTRVSVIAEAVDVFV